MKKWILVVSLVLLGALAFAACGDDGDGDGNAESVGDGDLPQVSDDAIDTGIGEYQVTVSFNEDAVQADLDQIGAFLAGYDEEAEYVIQESFPQTGVATLNSDEDGFCETVVSSLEAESFVTSASCGPQLEPGDIDVDDVVTGDLTDGELDDGVTTSPVCAEDTPDCVDTLDTNGSEGIPPSEEDLPPAPPDLVPGVENQYTITIRFNETVLADQLDEVGARIRDFDPDAEYVIQESFPQTGVANFVATTEDACLALVQGLETETFVTSVSCGPQLEPGDPDPDEPVVNDLP